MYMYIYIYIYIYTYTIGIIYIYIYIYIVRSPPKGARGAQDPPRLPHGGDTT